MRFWYCFSNNFDDVVEIRIKLKLDVSGGLTTMKYTNNHEYMRQFQAEMVLINVDYEFSPAKTPIQRFNAIYLNRETKELDVQRV